MSETPATDNLTTIEDESKWAVSCPPSQALMDDIFREKIVRARGLTPDQRLRIGMDLFETSIGLMKDGIRWQFPGSTAEDVQRILNERLEWMRKYEDRDRYSRLENYSE